MSEPDKLELSRLITGKVARYSYEYNNHNMTHRKAWAKLLALDAEDDERYQVNKTAQLWLAECGHSLDQDDYYTWGTAVHLAQYHPEKFIAWRTYWILTNDQQGETK